MTGVTVSGGDVAVRVNEIPDYEAVYLARETIRAIEKAFKIPGVRQACDAWKTQKYTGLIQQTDPAMKPRFIKIDISTIRDDYTKGAYHTTVSFSYRKAEYIFHTTAKKNWIERVKK